MKKLIVLMVMAVLMASAALAADNLPLDGQKGLYVGTEIGTNYMHVVTKPSVDTTYTVALPAVLVTAGYGTDEYAFGIFGGVGTSEVRNAFDEFGDASDTVPVFGANAKAAPLKVGPVKLGLVADIKYVGDANDSARGSLDGYPLSASLDYGPLLIWSAGVIAQAQPCKYFVVYAGEKYEDLAHADVTMKASLDMGSMTHANSMSVKFKQVDNFATVGGIVVPLGNVNIIAQGKYTKDVPVSVTANVEYHF